MLEVCDGAVIRVATREAVTDDDLHRLETEVLAAFRHRNEEEATARTDAQRLYLAAIRQICRFLKSERAAPMPSVLPPDGLES
jgi:F-type H+-transporting ATPase subunit epsilon